MIKQALLYSYPYCGTEEATCIVGSSSRNPFLSFKVTGSEQSGSYIWWQHVFWSHRLQYSSNYHCSDHTQPGINDFYIFHISLRDCTQE